MKKDSVKYADFYKKYSLFLKKGIIIEMDHSDKESIAKLQLCESSTLKAGNLAKSSPYFELAVFFALQQFDRKLGVEKWAESAAAKAGEKEKEGKVFRDVDKKDLLDWIENTLGSVKVRLLRSFT
ncbi:unnamed protein product [Cylicocyclus nassatus]|uniref:Uncharacterized protein n=1 Tax=Cylicocyclus nassatus TaxID=53992 RepID=A0AA36GWU3_CYLNA|nr:unnamed protein product [Cylicocyclus nassatus]